MENPFELKRNKLNSLKKYILLDTVLLDECVCRISIPNFPEEETFFYAIKDNSYTIYDKDKNKMGVADTLREAQIVLESEALTYLNRNYYLENGEIKKRLSL